MAQTIQSRKQKLVMGDSDVDGACGLINTYLAWREENPMIYAHFRAPNDVQPGTQAAQFNPSEVLNYLSADVGEIITIDIPPPRELPRRAALVTFIQQVRALGVNYVIYDVYDHAEAEYWQQVRNAGAVLRLVPDGYSVKLLPLIDAGKKIEKVHEEWSLLGSIADFDESVASRTPLDLEQIVAEVVDPVYKFVMGNEVPQSDVRMYGKTGAIVKYAVERLGADVWRFVSWAQELYSKLPQNQRLPAQPQYRRIGSVVVGDASQVAIGLQWKLAWKLTYVANADVAVLYNVRQQRGNQEFHGIIVAANWRNKSRVAPVIDQVVSEIAQRLQASVVGHTGAKSLMWPAGAIDTLRVAEEIASMISQRIWTPSVSHLILDTTVAAAVREDFARIMSTLLQILERQQQLLEKQQQMYERYLDLKERQVRLLEQSTQTQRARYD